MKNIFVLVILIPVVIATIAAIGGIVIDQFGIIDFEGILYYEKTP